MNYLTSGIITAYFFPHSDALGIDGSPGKADNTIYSLGITVPASSFLGRTIIVNSSDLNWVKGAVVVIAGTFILLGPSIFSTSVSLAPGNFLACSIGNTRLYPIPGDLTVNVPVLLAILSMSFVLSKVS